MAPIFKKLALFCLLLATFCVSAAAAEGAERWVFSSVPGGITGGRAASVVYGDGQFVTVGRGGAISTSPDGRGWTVRNSGVDFDLLSVAWGEEAGYVAVGGSGRITLISADGVNWAKHETPILERAHFVSYAGGKYFAGVQPISGSLYDSTLYYSFDGVHWAATVPSLCSWGYDGFSIAYGEGVYFGITYFMAGMLTSTDGVTWNDDFGFGMVYTGALCWLGGPPYPPECMSDYNVGVFALAYGNNLFLAGGPGDAFGWSEDGTTWIVPWAHHWEGNRVVMPDEWKGNYDYNHIVYDGTRFVVIRSHYYRRDYEMCFTPDGKSLTPIYSGFPKPISALASNGKDRIVVLSEDGQLGLLSKDTTAVSVHPNPSSPKSAAKLSLRQSGKNLTITLPNNFRQGFRPDITLYSISGKKQKVSPVFTATASAASLSISHIPSGLYVLKVIGEKDIWQGQVVIKR